MAENNQGVEKAKLLEESADKVTNELAAKEEEVKKYTNKLNKLINKIVDEDEEEHIRKYGAGYEKRDDIKKKEYKQKLAKAEQEASDLEKKRDELLKKTKAAYDDLL